MRGGMEVEMQDVSQWPKRRAEEAAAAAKQKATAAKQKAAEEAAAAMEDDRRRRENELDKWIKHKEKLMPDEDETAPISPVSIAAELHNQAIGRRIKGKDGTNCTIIWAEKKKDGATNARRTADAYAVLLCDDGHIKGLDSEGIKSATLLQGFNGLILGDAVKNLGQGLNRKGKELKVNWRTQLPDTARKLDKWTKQYGKDNDETYKGIEEGRTQLKKQYTDLGDDDDASSVAKVLNNIIFFNDYINRGIIPNWMNEDIKEINKLNQGRDGVEQLQTKVPFEEIEIDMERLNTLAGGETELKRERIEAEKKTKQELGPAFLVPRHQVVEERRTASDQSSSSAFDDSDSDDDSPSSSPTTASTHQFPKLPPSRSEGRY